MSRLYTHLAEIAETANGGFTMTRAGRRYFGHFLRRHGKALQSVKTYAALIDILGQCNAADFAATRREMLPSQPIDEIDACFAGHGAQRLVA